MHEQPWLFRLLELRLICLTIARSFLFSGMTDKGLQLPLLVLLLQHTARSYQLTVQFAEIFSFFFFLI